MTREDVDWILRYDCDEIQLQQVQMNQISALGVSITMRDNYDENGRLTKVPYLLGGRKIKIESANLTPGWIFLLKNAVPKVAINLL